MISITILLSPSYQSHQSGIETNIFLLFRLLLGITTNRTKVELKRLDEGSLSPFFTYQSHQSGIETICY